MHTYSSVCMHIFPQKNSSYFLSITSKLIPRNSYQMHNNSRRIIEEHEKRQVELKGDVDQLKGKVDQILEALLVMARKDDDHQATAVTENVFPPLGSIISPQLTQTTTT